MASREIKNLERNANPICQFICPSMRAITTNNGAATNVNCLSKIAHN